MLKAWTLGTLACVLVLCMALPASGTQIPYGPKMDARLKAIEAGGVTLTSDSVSSANIVAGTIVSSDIASSTVAAGDVVAYDTENATLLSRVARAVWDPTGTASDGSSTTSSGVHGLGVYLPQNALLTRSYLYFVTQPTDAENTGNQPTLALKCEDSENILAEVFVHNQAAGSILDGKQTGTSALMAGSISDICEISATVADDDFDAGKAFVFVEYLVVD